MIASRIDDNSDEAYATVLALGWEGIRRSAHYYWDRIQTALNIPNSGKDVPTPWGGTRRVYPNPSLPGEPPRKVTGFGAGNVVEDFDQPNMKARVGIMENADYMAAHELGTNVGVKIRAKKAKALMWWNEQEQRWLFRKSVNRPPQPARPFLLTTLRKFWPQIRAMAGPAASGSTGVSASP